MTSIRKTWPNLSAGEIDAAALAGREDLTFYDKGLKKALNVISLPTGGFRDRGGLVHVAYVRNQLSSLTPPPSSASVPSGAVSITTDLFGEPCVKSTSTITVPGGGGAVVTVDFGSARTIGLVDLFNATISGAVAQDALRIEYSTDNSNWSTFGSAFDAGSAQSRRAGLAAGQSVSARYWRVFGTSAIAGRTISFDALVFWQETASLSNVKLYGFAYDTEADYLMVQTDRNIDVYNGRVHVASVRAPHPHSAVPEVNRAQSLDTLILFHADKAPWRIFRYRGDGEWTCDVLPLENIPLEQFGDTTYVNGTNEKQEIFFSGFTAGSDRYNLSYAGAATAGVTFAGGTVGGTGVTSAAAMQAALQALPEIGSGNVTVTCTAANTFEIEFVNDKGQQEHPVLATFFLGPGTGDEIISATRTQKGKKGGEAIISDARGWPACGTFYQARLVLAGLKARPATALFSVLQDFFNFNIELEGDGALSLTIDNDQVKRIRQIYPGRNLALFTDDSEFWIADRVIVKGERISFAQASRRGIRAGLDVLEADDQTLFVQADGQSVRAFAYADQRQSYLAPNISRLSPHLVREPVDWSVRRGGGYAGAELVFVANADGEGAICGLMADEEFLAWHHFSTLGDILSFGTEGLSEVYAAVERTVDGTTTRRLEVYDDSCVFDAAVVESHGSPASVQTGLDHLEGATVGIWADGRYQGTATVASGQISLPVAASEVQAGLAFTVEGETMPYREARLGSLVDQPCRFHTVTLSLSGTAAVSVGANGGNLQNVDLRGMGTNAFQPAGDILFTGEKRIVGIGGYSNQSTIRVSQPHRAPLGIVRAITGDGRLTKGMGG